MKAIKGTFFVGFLLLILVFQSADLFSQRNIEVLVLTNSKSNKSVKIRSARRIIIWLDDNVRIKGRLNDVLNDSIVIDNQLIGINQIKKIRINALGSKIIGGAFLASGTLIFGAGTGVLLSANSASGCAGPAVATALGVFTMTIGTGVALISVPILFIGKKFDCTQKWQLSTAMVVN